MNRRRCQPVVSLFAGVVCALAISSLPRGFAAGMDPAAKASAPAPLTLAAEKGLTVAATGGDATWDFGKRPVQTGEVVVHTFTLRNTGTTPLRIESLLTSCHCTAATLVLPPAKKSESATDDGYTLAPGKSVGVRIAIDTALAHAVDFRKMVWVYVKGRDEAALTLTVTGTFTPR